MHWQNIFLGGKQSRRKSGKRFMENKSLSRSSSKTLHLSFSLGLSFVIAEPSCNLTSQSWRMLDSQVVNLSRLSGMSLVIFSAIWASDDKYSRCRGSECRMK